MPDEHDDEHGAAEDFKQLRAKAKRADDLEPEVATLRQENAILKAGIVDLTPAKQRALLAAHEGDLDPEALRKTATDLGFAPAPEAPEPEAPQVSAEEQQAHKRMQEATAAAQPSEAKVKTLDDEINAAKSHDEVIAILEREGLANVEP